MKVFAEGKSWADAEVTCIDHGGHLATIGSQAQNDWIATKTTTTTWHGATDQFSEGTWTGPDGQSELPFSNWHPGEPNGGTGESCGSIYAGDSATCGHCGQWNDAGCSYNGYHFVCGLGNGAAEGKKLHI